jgi:rhodanese-related sulfurtransferase
MHPLQLFDPATSTYTHLVFDDSSRDAIVINPAPDQLERDVAVLRQYGLQLVWIVANPSHSEGIEAAMQLAHHTGSKVAAPTALGDAAVDASLVTPLSDGAVLLFGSEVLTCRISMGDANMRMQYQWRDHTFAFGQSLGAVQVAAGYAGDISPALAHAWWQSGQAALVDVRSEAEREWVGFVPGALALAWKQWPGMTLNPHFDAGLRAGVPQNTPIVLLCRSGVRSIAAAKRATEMGWLAYNILEGFEGDADAQGHRGNRGGWRMRGLPWRQG